MSSTNECAICLEPVEDDVEPLTGCIHRFHPACIIDYLRHPESGGRCPLCRRNPFAEQEQGLVQQGLVPFPNDDEFDDDPWRALELLDRIKKTQIRAVNSENRKKRKRPEVERMNSRLKKARETREIARVIRKDFLESDEHLKMRNELQTLKNETLEYKKRSRDTARLLRKKKRELMKRKRLPNNQDDKIKSRTGSKISPLWQYKEDNGEWSDRMSSTQIRKMYKDGQINHSTLIRHPELPNDVEFSFLRLNRRMMV